MDSGRVSVRYAMALLNWSVENECAERVYQETATLLSAIGSSAQLNEILSNPGTNSNKANTILLEFAKKFTPNLQPFLSLLVRKQRLGSLRNILLIFQLKFRQKQGITRVELTCPIELSEDTKERIENHLAEEIGRKLELHYTVNPEIIGGFIATIEGKQLDKSVKNELLLMSKKLQSFA